MCRGWGQERMRPCERRHWMTSIILRLFFFKDLFLHTWVFCLYLYLTCVWCLWSEEGVGYLELGAGNWTQVLYESYKSPYPPPSPLRLGLPVNLELIALARASGICLPSSLSAGVRNVWDVYHHPCFYGCSSLKPMSPETTEKLGGQLVWKPSSQEAELQNLGARAARLTVSSSTRLSALSTELRTGEQVYPTSVKYGQNGGGQ